jgi:hypothetical protein
MMSAAHHVLKVAFILSMGFTPLQAKAACTTISSVTLTIGAPPVHVTPVDANNNACTALNPSTITWSPLGSPAIASGSPDATGFNLIGLAVGNVTATLTSSVAGSTPGNLAITVVAPPVKVGTTSP